LCYPSEPWPDEALERGLPRPIAKKRKTGGGENSRMTQKDYYQALGIEKGASPQKIKEAYRKLAFQYHPDRNKENPSAVEKMKEINEAYAVLSDSKKRNDYDRFHEQYGPNGYDRFKQRYSEQDIFRGSDINHIFEEMAKAFGFRGFEEIFNESYGSRYQSFEFRRPGVFGRGFIFFGPGHGRSGPKEIPISSEIFPGVLGKLARYLLKKTLGFREPGRGKDLEEAIYLHPRQALEGAKGKYVHRRRSKELLITIPPGMKEGQKIRLKGMGEPGKDGGEPGDLYLKVKIKIPLLEKVKGLFKI
jgi:curved DNA-binding protein CbpA